MLKRYAARIQRPGVPDEQTIYTAYNVHQAFDYASPFMAFTTATPDVQDAGMMSATVTSICGDTARVTVQVLPEVPHA